MARTMEALRDFQAIAESAGAKRLVAVATAAMRDANNASRFTERVQRELGIRIEIIGGLTEARLGFVGAVRGLSVSNGILFDLGGGSLQITRFGQPPHGRSHQSAVRRAPASARNFLPTIRPPASSCGGCATMCEVD